MSGLRDFIVGLSEFGHASNQGDAISEELTAQVREALGDSIDQNNAQLVEGFVLAEYHLDQLAVQASSMAIEVIKNTPSGTFGAAVKGSDNPVEIDKSNGEPIKPTTEASEINKDTELLFKLQ